MAAVVALVTGVVLLVSLTQLSFSNAPNFGRAATEPLLAAVIVALWERGRTATLALGLMAVGGVALAGWTVWANTPLA